MLGLFAKDRTMGFRVRVPEFGRDCARDRDPLNTSES